MLTKAIINNGYVEKIGQSRKKFAKKLRESKKLRPFLPYAQSVMVPSMIVSEKNGKKCESTAKTWLDTNKEILDQISDFELKKGSASLFQI